MDFFKKDILIIFGGKLMNRNNNISITETLMCIDLKTMSCSNYDITPYTMDKLLQILMVKHTYITLTLKCHKANDLNSTYLWNRHLGHVRKERMKELHANGFLESFDF
jgi:hypothetical protein